MATGRGRPLNARLGRRSPAHLDRLLTTARAAGLGYDHVGSTFDRASWPERTPLTYEGIVGHGQAAFEAASAALRWWDTHRAIGAHVLPAGVTQVEGATILLVLRRWPLEVVVPNRIVAVVDEPRRTGFTYGTVEGHDEAGEATFTVWWRDDDSVIATILVDAVPHSRAARLIHPAVVALARRANRAYVKALQRAASLAAKA